MVGIREGAKLMLSRTDKGVPIYIRGITHEQEIKIDKSKIYYGEIRFVDENNNHIRYKDIYMYGEVNVDSDGDLALIERYNFIPKEGGWMYSNFDYEEGNYITTKLRHLQFPTYNAIDWFLYNHCLIGKPKRIIVYANNPIKIK